MGHVPPWEKSSIKFYYKHCYSQLKDAGIIRLPALSRARLNDNCLLQLQVNTFITVWIHNGWVHINHDKVATRFSGWRHQCVSDRWQNQLSNIYPTTSLLASRFSFNLTNNLLRMNVGKKIACGRWSCFLSWCSFRYIMWISRKLVLLVFTYNISQYICWYSGYFCWHLVQRCTQWLQMLSVPSQDKQAMQRLLEASGWTNGWDSVGEKHAEPMWIYVDSRCLTCHERYMDELSMTSRSDGSLE